MKIQNISLPFFIILFIFFVATRLLHKNEFIFLPNSLFESRINELNNIAKDNITAVSILTIYDNKVCLSEISNKYIIEQLTNAISNNNLIPDKSIHRFKRKTIISLKQLMNTIHLLLKMIILVPV